MCSLGKKQILTLALSLAVAALALPAFGADLYVRKDGADTCDGKADKAAGSGSCALKTIAKANQLAVCGDTVRIGAGEFVEGQIQITNSCADASVKKFVGAGLGDTYGVGGTTWIAGAVEVDDSACTPDASNAGVFKCPQPTGTGTVNSPNSCLLQQYTTSVFFQDENGVKGDMKGPVCLTRNTTGAADVAAKEGNYFEDGSSYYVRAWDDRDPRQAGSSGVGLVAAVSGCKSQDSAGIRVTGANVQISNLRVLTPCYVSIGIPSPGKKLTLDNVHVFGGTVWAYSGSQDVTYRHLKVRNALRRPNNTGDVVGTTWDAGSQCMATSATGFTMVDVETYGCREGFSFSNGASNGTADGLFIHGSYNHGLKIIDTTTHDIKIRDVLTYNNQEPLFIECPYNIKIENSTFPFSVPGGCAIIQGNPSGCPADRPHGIEFYNNVIDCLIWHNYGGDTWAKGGHKLDYNTYISDNGRGYAVRNVQLDKSMSLSAWQNWTGDPCPDCLRDPHSVTATRAQVYKKYMERDDRLDANYDFDLRTDSPVIGKASAAWGDGIDLEGVARSTPPDPGAFDHTDGKCGNGTREGAEVCDGADLGGATCASQGQGTGTLACNSSCQFDYSGCVSTNQRPADVQNNRRNDTK